MVWWNNCDSLNWLTIAAAIYYFGEVRSIRNSLIATAAAVGRFQALAALTCRVMFYQPPTLGEKDLLACPVRLVLNNSWYAHISSFLFADYHRLSSVGGEHALAKIVTTLFTSCEKHYGWLTVRLYCAFKPTFGMGIVGWGGMLRYLARFNKATMRRTCGVPVVWITVLLAVILLIGIELFGYALENGQLAQLIKPTEVSTKHAHLIPSNSHFSQISTRTIQFTVEQYVGSTPHQRRQWTMTVKRLKQWCDSSWMIWCIYWYCYRTPQFGSTRTRNMWKQMWQRCQHQWHLLYVRCTPIIPPNPIHSVVLIFVAYPLVLALSSMIISPPARRIKSSLNHLGSQKFEGFMQRLQTEVNLLVDLIQCMNAFTKSQTRLYVVGECI